MFTRHASVAVLTFVGSAATAADVVEIRHTKFKQSSNHAVHYWCITRDEVPEAYLDTSKYSLASAPTTVRDSGALIMTTADNTVYLTSAECVEETKEALAAMGMSPDDLTINPQ